MPDNSKYESNSPSRGKNSNSSSGFLSTEGGKTKSNAIEIPSINLPKGGGDIKGIDEKFSVNAVNGTSSFSIPLPYSLARAGSPSINLSYDSGSGNSIFGLGWKLGLSTIKRKTDKELPQYLDLIESDTFLFSEAEDLVPEYTKKNDGTFILDAEKNLLFVLLRPYAFSVDLSVKYRIIYSATIHYPIVAIVCRVICFDT